MLSHHCALCRLSAADQLLVITTCPLFDMTCGESDLSLKKINQKNRVKTILNIGLYYPSEETHLYVSTVSRKFSESQTCDFFKTLFLTPATSGSNHKSSCLGWLWVGFTGFCVWRKPLLWWKHRFLTKFDIIASFKLQNSRFFIIWLWISTNFQGLFISWHHLHQSIN